MSAMFVFYLVLNSTQIPNWSGRISIAYSKKKFRMNSAKVFKCLEAPKFRLLEPRIFFYLTVWTMYLLMVQGKFLKPKYIKFIKLFCFLRKHKN